MAKRLKHATRGRLVRLAAAVLALSLGVPGSGSAHGTLNGFQEDFEKVAAGPLAGSLPADRWEIKSGEWTVSDQTGLDAPALNTNKILIQNSKASTAANGVEPVAFVRGRTFRSFTMQVTAAMMDPTSAFGDLVNGASVGIVFRAPITDGISDQNNLYLFSAIVTGVAPGFPTGKAFALFKRVARGYHLLHTKVASTWADFSRPHDYKVVVGGGRILAYVDGRMVIDHTDIPSPDLPTFSDPFPGLPFDSGAVGLRTSGTRAWFDNVTVVGNDAYEARANALDARTDWGASGSGPQGSVRRGSAVQLSADSRRAEANMTDTGYLYHDHDFDEAIVRPFVQPGTGAPASGATLGAVASGGRVTSTARMSGVNISFNDPNGRVSVLVRADGLEATATASCDGADSSVNILNGVVFVTVASADRSPDTVIGPIPLKFDYRPNTVIFERPGMVAIVAHARTVLDVPQRVEMSALRIVLPDGGQTVHAQTIGVQNSPVPTTRTPEMTVQTPPLEQNLIQVVAGRYCP